MPTYLMLTTLTEKGVQTLRKPGAPRRGQSRRRGDGGEGRRSGRRSGYDFVNIVEAPDDLTIAKVSIALGARGSAKLESLRLSRSTSS